jgi:hypothetical protein
MISHISFVFCLVLLIELLKADIAACALVIIGAAMNIKW